MEREKITLVHCLGFLSFLIKAKVRLPEDLNVFIWDASQMEMDACHCEMPEKRTLVI
jgi:hypothetical protein